MEFNRYHAIFGGLTILIFFLIVFGIWYFLFSGIPDDPGNKAPPKGPTGMNFVPFVGPEKELIDKTVFIRKNPVYEGPSVFMATTTDTIESGDRYFIVKDNQSIYIPDPIKGYNNLSTSWKILQRNYKDNITSNKVSSRSSLVFESVMFPKKYLSFIETKTDIISILKEENGNEKDENYYRNNGEILFDITGASNITENFTIHTSQGQLYLSSLSTKYKDNSVGLYSTLETEKINDIIKYPENTYRQFMISPSDNQ